MTEDTKFLIEMAILGCGTLIAGVGLFFVALELHRTRKTNKGQFLLNLNELFQNYDEVTEQVFKHDWHPELSQNKIPWSNVNSYMGLFERIKILIDDKIIDLKLFSDLYGYRVRYIVLNDCLYEEKLSKKPQGWRKFIELARDLANLRKREGFSETDDKQFERFFQRVDALVDLLARNGKKQ